MIVLLTGGVLVSLLAGARFARDRRHYLTVLKACCMTLVVEWLLLALPGRAFRSGYAGTERVFWINLTAVGTATLVFAWLTPVLVMARDPD